MKLGKNFLKLFIILFVSYFTSSTFAADQAIKEDLTPPPASGPLTADRISPIVSMGANTIQPQAPVNKISPQQPSVNPETPTQQ